MEQTPQKELSDVKQQLDTLLLSLPEDFFATRALVNGCIDKLRADELNGYPSVIVQGDAFPEKLAAVKENLQALLNCASSSLSRNARDAEAAAGALNAAIHSLTTAPTRDPRAITRKDLSRRAPKAEPVPAKPAEAPEASAPDAPDAEELPADVAAAPVEIDGETITKWTNAIAPIFSVVMFCLFGFKVIPNFFPGENNDALFSTVGSLASAFVSYMAILIAHLVNKKRRKDYYKQIRDKYPGHGFKVFLRRNLLPSKWIAPPKDIKDVTIIENVRAKGGDHSVVNIGGTIITVEKDAKSDDAPKGDTHA